MQRETITFRVSKQTDEKKLSGAIVKTLNEGTLVRLTCIGSVSNYTAIKSLIIARGLVASSAKELKITPGFEKKKDREGNEDLLAIVYNISLSNTD